MKNLPTIIFWAIIIISVIKSFMKQSKQMKDAPTEKNLQPGQRRIDYKIPKFMDVLIDAEDFSTSLETNVRDEIQSKAAVKGEEDEVQQVLPETSPAVAAPVVQENQVVIPASNTLISDLKFSLKEKQSLRQAFLMSEILQKPKALRHRVHG